jgi:electron transfer flavoprotein alpha subunit
MQILVIAERDGQSIRRASRSALSFAYDVADQAGGDVECLILGHQLDAVAAEAANYAPVLLADSAVLAWPLADRYAHVIANVAKERRAALIVAASNTFAKDIVSRAAGLLGGAMAGDVVGHAFLNGELLLERPMYAGAIQATVALCGEPKIVTVRPSAYPPREAARAPFSIASVAVDDAALPNGVEFERLEAKQTDRPDVTEARVVVSGGRGVKSSDDFERLVGGLADALGGATGSTRALVDAGITPNDLQIGQTGKIVAPELYIAVGMSGAIQHLAGMKNAMTVVAVNKDPDAPMFDAADYGLVGDLYEVVPALIEKLQRG